MVREISLLSIPKTRQTSTLFSYPAVAETGAVWVSADGKEAIRVAVQETAPDSGIFTATRPVSGANTFTVSYGFWALGPRETVSVK